MKANDPMTHHRNPPSTYGYVFITFLPQDIEFLGILLDSWFSLDKYLEMEKGQKSTFLFIPFKDRPGKPLGKIRPSIGPPVTI
jgi:hypothetical protein